MIINHREVLSLCTQLIGAARGPRMPGRLSGKIHLEMMEAETCTALPFSALLNCRY